MKSLIAATVCVLMCGTALAETAGPVIAPASTSTVGAEAPASNNLAASTDQSNSKEVQVRNDLTQGAINAGIYKDGRLLAIERK